MILKLNCINTGLTKGEKPLKILKTKFDWLNKILCDMNMEIFPIKIFYIMSKRKCLKIPNCKTYDIIILIFKLCK